MTEFEIPFDYHKVHKADRRKWGKAGGKAKGGKLLERWDAQMPHNVANPEARGARASETSNNSSATVLCCYNIVGGVMTCV